MRLDGVKMHVSLSGGADPHSVSKLIKTLKFKRKNLGPAITVAALLRSTVLFAGCIYSGDVCRAWYEWEPSEE